VAEPEDPSRRASLVDDGFVDTGTAAADGDRIDVEKIAVIASVTVEDCRQ
jgi:hypothetical protein